jgi:hypothetical protein
MMRVEDYEALPDLIKPEEVETLIDVFLREEASDSPDKWRQKLDVLSDRQWHTYQRPSDDVRARLREWILKRWQDHPVFYELVMGTAYSFALDKPIFERALNNYHGDQRWEYLRILEGSSGETIDPYFSLKSPNPLARP